MEDAAIAEIQREQTAITQEIIQKHYVPNLPEKVLREFLTICPSALLKRPHNEWTDELVMASLTSAALNYSTALAFTKHLKRASNVTKAVTELANAAKDRLKPVYHIKDPLDGNTASTLLDVDISNVLPLDAKLRDNTTHLRVAIVCKQDDDKLKVRAAVVSPNAFPGCRAVPCVLYADSSFSAGGKVYTTLDLDGSTTFKAKSTQRLLTLATECPVPITTADVAEQQFVGIQALENFNYWEGGGVFLVDNKNEYLKSLREHGIHVMGRVALMHRILFGLAGVDGNSPKPFFRIHDDWKGTSVVSKAEVLECIKPLVSAAVRDTYRVPITSFALVSGRCHDGLVSSAFESLLDGVPLETQPVLTRKLAVLVAERYKARLLQKVGASVIIGPVPHNELLDTSHGIYGIYSASNWCDGRFSGARYMLGFNELPWAVAAPFVDVCL